MHHIYIFYREHGSSFSNNNQYIINLPLLDSKTIHNVGSQKTLQGEQWSSG